MNPLKPSNNPAITEYVVTYRETSDGPQLELVKPTQAEANKEAFRIFTEGGIAIVTSRTKVIPLKFSNFNIEDLE